MTKTKEQCEKDIEVYLQTGGTIQVVHERPADTCFRKANGGILEETAELNSEFGESDE